MSQRRPLVAGNWKMNGLRAALGEIQAVAGDPVVRAAAARIDVALCPPATLLAAAAQGAAAGPVGIGAQDCHPAASGAHTGDLSAEMIADAGARYVIVGHSERRADHGETNARVAAKAAAVARVGLVAIVCVGETLAEREAGTTLDVVQGQIAGSIPTGFPGRLALAYEPVWAIGTGLTPSLEDIAEVHAAARRALADKLGADRAETTPILYGGSVKPSNAGDILKLADVDGALVGGASLKAADFVQIIAACPGAR